MGELTGETRRDTGNHRAARPGLPSPTHRPRHRARRGGVLVPLLGLSGLGCAGVAAMAAIGLSGSATPVGAPATAVPTPLLPGALGPVAGAVAADGPLVQQPVSATAPRLALSPVVPVVGGSAPDAAPLLLAAGPYLGSAVAPQSAAQGVPVVVDGVPMIVATAPDGAPIVAAPLLAAAPTSPLLTGSSAGAVVAPVPVVPMASVPGDVPVLDAATPAPVLLAAPALPPATTVPEAAPAVPSTAPSVVASPSPTVPPVLALTSPPVHGFAFRRPAPTPTPSTTPTDLSTTASPTPVPVPTTEAPSPVVPPPAPSPTAPVGDGTQDGTQDGGTTQGTAGVAPEPAAEVAPAADAVDVQP